MSIISCLIFITKQVVREKVDLVSLPGTDTLYSKSGEGVS